MYVALLNKYEICDVFSAAADAGAGFIQLGPMMVQGKGHPRADLAISRDEWENIKQQIRKIKNYHTPYTFCKEMICQHRPPLGETEFSPFRGDCLILWKKQAE